MTMQRRHFELIAESLRSAKPMPHDTDQSARLSQWVSTCNRFARDLNATNPQFNRERFLRACGVEG